MISSGTRIGKVARLISGHSSIPAGGSPLFDSISSTIFALCSSHFAFISAQNAFSPIVSSSSTEILNASSVSYLTLTCGMLQYLASQAAQKDLPLAGGPVMKILTGFKPLNQLNSLFSFSMLPTIPFSLCHGNFMDFNKASFSSSSRPSSYSGVNSGSLKASEVFILRLIVRASCQIGA